MIKDSEYFEKRKMVENVLFSFKSDCLKVDKTYRFLTTVNFLVATYF